MEHVVLPVPEGEHVETALTALGFQCGVSNPCIYWNADRDARVVVHVDDFAIWGMPKDIAWLVKDLEAVYELKWQQLGPGPNESKAIKYLSRRISWTNNGITYEADPKHAVEALPRLGLVVQKATARVEQHADDEDIRRREGLHKELQARQRRCAGHQLEVCELSEVAAVAQPRSERRPLARVWRG